MCHLESVAILGCGSVGATIAFALMQSGLCPELILVDADGDKARGEALDLSHGLAYTPRITIREGTYQDAAQCSLAILAAGASQSPGQSRLSLLEANMALLHTLIPQLMEQGFDGMLLVVSNPVDLLTYGAWRLSGLPAHRVFGSGTLLDTARLQYHLSQQLGVNCHDVHALVLGEHGEHLCPLWSQAHVSGIPLSNLWRELGISHPGQQMEQLQQQVQQSAAQIIDQKGSTCYGIGLAVARIVRAIARDEHTLLPVSVPLQGEYGFQRLCLSVPVMLGTQGIERIVKLSLTQEELYQLQSAAHPLQELLHGLNLP